MKKLKRKEKQFDENIITQATTSTNFTKRNKMLFYKTITSNFSQEQNKNEILSRNKSIKNKVEANPGKNKIYLDKYENGLKYLNESYNLKKNNNNNNKNSLSNVAFTHKNINKNDKKEVFILWIKFHFSKLTIKKK